MSKCFHITVTNSKTNETVLDIDTDCIVGAVHQDGNEQDSTICLGYTDCNGVTIANTAFGAVNASRKVTRSPAINLLLMSMLAGEALKRKEESSDGMDSKGEDGSTIIPFSTSRKDGQS